MPRMTFLGYVSGSSTAHKLDARFKFIGLILLSVAVIHSAPAPLALLTVLAAVYLRSIGVRLGILVKELRMLLLLLAAVILARMLTTEGSVLFQLGFLSFSFQGLVDGLLIAWRLILIVLLGLLYISTTRPGQIKSAIEWFFKPVPGVSAARIGTMLALLLNSADF